MPLVGRLEYEGRHKTDYPSRRAMFGSASFKTKYIRYSSSRRIIRLAPVFILDRDRDA